MQETAPFAQTIHRIALEVKSLAVPDELFSSRAFVEIYEKPLPSFPAAAALMGARDATPHEKKIAGFAMQRLPPEEFVSFLEATLQAVEAGATTVDVLESAAFAPLNFGRQSLVMKYDSSRVQALAARLLELPQLSPQRKAYLRDKVLTGVARRDYVDYMGMIGRRVEE